MRKKFIFMLLLVVLCITSVKAEEIIVKNDNFKTLDKNYVRFENFDLSKAKFETTNDKLKIDKIYNIIGDITNYTLYYEGVLNYGTEANTNPVTNSIDGVVTLKFENGATLYDGTKADVLITIDDIEFAVCKAKDGWDNSQTVYVPMVFNNSYPQGFSVGTFNPFNKLMKEKPTENTTAYKSDASLGSSYRINVKVLKHGTDTPVDETKYPKLMFAVNDLDVDDFTANRSYDGIYTESIELIDGVNGDVHLAEDKGNSINPETNDYYVEQTILKSETGRHNGTWIHPDNHKIRDLKIRYDDSAHKFPRDYNTYYSGFITSVSPQNFTFYYQASQSSATILFNQYSATIIETDDGNGVSTPNGTNSFLIGSDQKYVFKPNAGYHTKSVIADGVSQEIKNENDEGEYTFKSLYTSPLVKLVTDRANSRFGLPLSDESANNDEVHTLDLKFEENEYIIHFNRGEGDDDGKKMDDMTIKFNDDKKITKNIFTKKDYEFSKWKAYDKNENVLKDANGNDLYLTDEEIVKGKFVAANGEEITLVAQFIASVPVKNERTGAIGVGIFLIIGIAAVVLYKNVNKKNKLA